MLRTEGAGAAEASSGVPWQGTGEKQKLKCFHVTQSNVLPQRAGDCSVGFG